MELTEGAHFTTRIPSNDCHRGRSLCVRGADGHLIALSQAPETPE